METKQEKLKRITDLHLLNLKAGVKSTKISTDDLNVILEMAHESAEVNIQIDMNHVVPKQFTDIEERIAEHRERVKSRREYFDKQWSRF